MNTGLTAKEESLFGTDSPAIQNPVIFFVRERMNCNKGLEIKSRIVFRELGGVVGDDGVKIVKGFEFCKLFKQKKPPCGRFFYINLFVLWYETVSELHHFLDPVIGEVTLFELGEYIGQFVLHLEEEMIFELTDPAHPHLAQEALGTEIDDRHPGTMRTRTWRRRPWVPR